MFEKPSIAYAVTALLFLLPQTLYEIGRDPYILAVGIRFPLFRWQESGFGTSIIPVYTEVGYLSSGTIKWMTTAVNSTAQIYNRTAIATVIWLAGLLFLIAAAALVVSWHYLDNPEHAGYIGPLLFVTGGLFIAWGMVQFGLFFSGPSGYAIPLGVPILWFCAYLFWKDAQEETGDETLCGEGAA